MSPTRIVIDAAPRESFTVSLVGEEYLVTPPKSTIALGFAERAKEADKDPSLIRTELDGWIRTAFGPRQAAQVIARLDDPQDDLDLQHVMELMQALAEAANPDPSS